MNNDCDSPSYFQYWGKAKRDTVLDGAEYHLLPYHSLDVAAVGQVLLTRHSGLSERFTRLMGMPSESVVNWSVFLLGLHDLGKFAESFQQIRADLRQQFWPDNPIKKSNYSVRHDSLGQMLWTQKLRNRLFSDANEALTDFVCGTMEHWLNPMFGHHGWPPSNNDGRFKNCFVAHDQTAVLAFVRTEPSYE